ncbi:MAG TPA: phage major capsid protein [Caulobacterales bacterium]|nr:phage major capsid protein [Caulobacterales bacterium]
MNTRNLRAGLLASMSVAAILASAGLAYAKGEDSHAERLATNKAEQEKLLARCAELQAIADADDGRDLTKAEADEVAENMRAFERLEEDSERRLTLLAAAERLNKPSGRKTAPGSKEDVDDPNFRPAGSAARDLDSLAANSKTFGFKTLGEFAMKVRQSQLGQGTDARLKAAAASTIATEGVGADGGFAVPPEFRATIMQRVLSQDSLFGRTNPIPLSGNSITFPADMTTPWGSSGIQAYWEGEGDTRTQSKPKLEGVTAKLYGLSCLVPVSNELLEDAAALGGYIESKAPQVIDFKLSYALVWGNGVGMPLGFMNAPCLVTQAAESAQTTDTINAQNVVKMYSRMPADLRPNAVWLIHPDAEPQLPLMTIGNQPVYIPPGGLSGSPYGNLYGRPVIPHEVCETVGDLGDIMFVDMSSYLAVRKASGLQTAVSIHLWFDQNLSAYRFILRAGGQPWWSAAISPRDGSNTRSPFVTLASR